MKRLIFENDFREGCKFKEELGLREPNSMRKLIICAYTYINY